MLNSYSFGCIISELFLLSSFMIVIFRAVVTLFFEKVSYHKSIIVGNSMTGIGILFICCTLSFDGLHYSFFLNNHCKTNL